MNRRIVWTSAALVGVLAAGTTLTACGKDEPKRVACAGAAPNADTGLHIEAAVPPPAPRPMPARPAAPKPQPAKPAQPQNKPAQPKQGSAQKPDLTKQQPKSNTVKPGTKVYVAPGSHGSGRVNYGHTSAVPGWVWVYMMVDGHEQEVLQPVQCYDNVSHDHDHD